MTNSNSITDYDTYLFKQGNHTKLYEKLGSHVKKEGTSFAVWAPNAKQVSVVGNFNKWDAKLNILTQREDESGIWEGYIQGIGQGELYKYHIISNYNNYKVNKADPYALYFEKPPNTASVVWDIEYQWNDANWMENRHKRNNLDAPISIYEVHLGSWMRVPGENNRWLNFKEMAQKLVDYVCEMGFTHVEFMPITEHPFAGSWGYQAEGYFAPTSRYGTPQDFMHLVDCFHQKNIGVILDWVPSHFPSDEYGLVYFDGTHLYEHSDPKKGFHPEWKCYIFNHGRHEVKSFLMSSANFWLEKYHIDGFRVDAVASMLYLDYAREEGEWIPNKYGGNENLESVHFLQELNKTVYKNHSGVMMIAEESTAWPMVTKPPYTGGLGFGIKWNMGWMHDTLEYFKNDPIYRKYHHDQLTFSLCYAFSENFLLPLSHDEVVHGKGSLIGKMPGYDYDKFANLRLLYGYMYTHPGKKLLFMGSEFGQWIEWNYKESLDWHLLESPKHKGIQTFVKDLNQLYKITPALYEFDFKEDGFEWIDASDYENSIISFIRKGKTQNTIFIIVCNFTPLSRSNYSIGVPRNGYYKEVLNSDSKRYGGSNKGNNGGLTAENDSIHGKLYSISLTIPPLSIIIFKNEL